MAQGLAVDGIKARAMLKQASDALWEADNRKPLRTHTVDFGDACKGTKQEIWSEREDRLVAAGEGLSRRSRSQWMGDAISRSGKGKGHGAKGVRKHFEFTTLVAYILDDRDRVNMPAVEAMIAERKMEPNRVRAQLMRKHRAKMAYDAIDEYRDQFLVKHASRGDRAFTSKTYARLKKEGVVPSQRL